MSVRQFNKILQQLAENIHVSQRMNPHDCDDLLGLPSSTTIRTNFPNDLILNKGLSLQNDWVDYDDINCQYSCSPEDGVKTM